MSARKGRLHNRLMLAFAGFTLFVAALFGLYVAVFAYSVEDLWFSAVLEREAAAQLRHHAETGRWRQPRESFVTVVARERALPDGIAARLRAEPARTEFTGAQGRHYHLRALQPSEPAQRAWLVAEVSEQLVVRPMRAALLQLLAWSGVLVVALALLLGWWLARRTTAPLSRLAALVETSTPARLPTAFAAGFPNDEVGVLARGLENLITRTRDFIAREREFTRDASHELRTPLAVIRGATERLSMETGLSDAARQSLAHLRDSAGQLEQTVVTLLALAREEAIAPADTSVALLPVLERVIVEQSPRIEDKAVSVDIAVPARTMARLPTPVLHILLSNLVGNAFAHTRAGRVTIAVDGGYLRIANPAASGVRAIDFEPFVKGEESAGFGLGLSIVRRLCERYGIELRIENDANGTAACFALNPSDPVA